VLETAVASMIRAFVLLAVVRAIGEVGGMSPRGAATFAFLAGAIEQTLWITVPLDIDDRIRTGDVIVDLQRPVDFQLWWFGHDAGRAAHMVLARGIPPFVFGMVVLGIHPPASLASGALFVVSLALAYAVSFAWRFLISLSGFWLLDTRGAHSLAGGIVTVASGALIPLPLLPDAVAGVVRVLPFAAMVQTPFDVFTANRPAPGALLSQAAWAVGLLVLGRIVLHRAVTKLVVQGG
jgi:ABC-2 type transport system permease protein